MNKELIEKALNFYEQSPDGQYDEIAAYALKNLLQQQPSKELKQFIAENSYIYNRDSLVVMMKGRGGEYLKISDLEAFAPLWEAALKAEIEEKFINEVEQVKEGTQKLIDNSSPLTVNVYKNQLATYQNAIRIFKSIKGVKR